MSWLATLMGSKAKSLVERHEDAEEWEEDDLDVWDATDEYGYADGEIVGTEEWEDQKGMEALKLSLKLDPKWFLVKVVNFNSGSLAEQIEWLKDNCGGHYKRVGWSSGCSTKVGIAFERPNDAFFYKLRWR
jgi:hypothetical protein